MHSGMESYIRFDWAMKRLLRNKANYAVLEGLLNMNDKDIVTDTEPEQQCQTDNRQRGQEER